MNKPTAALWALIAMADLGLLLASAGAVVVVSLGAVLATIVVGGAVVRRLARSGWGGRLPLPATVRVTARRR